MSRRAEGNELVNNALVNLAPGSFIHGFNGKARYFTVLGSCVSLMIWHPQSRFFAMCHYVNARTPESFPELTNINRGAYADQILPYFWQIINQHQLSVSELVLTLAGGASSVASLQLETRFQVAKTNLAVAEKFIKQYQLIVNHYDIGGHSARRVKFCSESGKADITTLPETQSAWRR